MLAGLAAFRRLHRPGVWRFVVIQALCLFCFNFIGLYKASGLITSGLVALVFSLASTFNAINARMFFGDRITARTLLAGATGAAGLALIFWRDLFSGPRSGHRSRDRLGGVRDADVFLRHHGLPAQRGAGHHAGYRQRLGACRSAPWGWPCWRAASGQQVRLTTDPVYWTALVYLRVVGSVGAFTAYLLLVARIGSARASYATVVFPVVALAISTAVEGYSWTPLAVAGVGLTILGNVIMFWRPRASSARPDNASAEPRTPR